MADGTKIEWTDATWNPITGCSVVSPGCTNCYAMKLAGTRLKHHPSRAGLTIETKSGPVWNGKVRLNRSWFYQPTEWTRPRMVFVCAHGDLFAEGVPDDWILDVFTVMAICGHHTFQVLTKRADRMRDFVSRRDLLDDIYANWSTFSGSPREVWSWPLHNVWLGTSVEDQKRAEERIPLLLDTPSKLHWISAEPLLGKIELHKLRYRGGWMDAIAGHDSYDECYGGIRRRRLGWVVAGGESGPNARAPQPEWFRALRDQCASAAIPFLFKQWGNHRPCSDANGPYMLRCSKAEAGRHLDGKLHDQFPQIGDHHAGA